MSPEQQRIAIAEACGWVPTTALEAKENNITIRDRRFNGFRRKLLRWDQQKIFRGWGGSVGYHQLDIPEENAISTEELLRDYDLPTYWKHKDHKPTRHLPRYLTDLNAIHDAEQILTEDQHMEFRCALSHAVVSKWQTSAPPYEHMANSQRRLFVSATAEQRAEAFLRALNLWK